LVVYSLRIYIYIYQTETTKNSHIDSYVCICLIIQVIKYIGATLYKYTCKYVCIFNLQGETPLHVAASEGDTQMVELLIEKGADTNYRGDDVSTNYI
jgi:ankyrin repeat protein